jgi:hypothetical protein
MYACTHVCMYVCVYAADGAADAAYGRPRAGLSAAGRPRSSTCRRAAPMRLPTARNACIASRIVSHRVELSRSVEPLRGSTTQRGQTAHTACRPSGRAEGPKQGARESLWPARSLSRLSRARSPSRLSLARSPSISLLSLPLSPLCFCTSYRSRSRSMITH